MSGEERGQTVQVVKVSEGPGPRYVLDSQALGLMMRNGARDRPVVVVSVAGSFRGGKSFLLGFFLRYLNASRADQLSGKWLGKEDEPLRGFNWRAGCERETTGIHLWSKPVIVKLDNGEEVAVLLMDTQGTFDSESTLQDSSTIFALSTLISSVQIYNLFRNIQEDDLQHLHLFTDYGRLAAGDSADGGKAFQVLQFLVRDWTNAHEYPCGAKGGAGLLEKRLEMKSGQKQELREVRQHIRSCFEKIQCFLLPHPGLTVADANFNGCLSDIGEQFRMGLLELVPSLFDPKNLTAKVIGGERVKMRDLPIYFQNYIDVFNSEELPPAVSILQGTATAWLVAASRDAHEAYEARMEAAAAAPASVAPDAVRARHRDALDAAKQLFSAKKKLGSKEDADKHLDQLVKELDARLPLYMWQNEVKVRDALTAAKQSYDDQIHAVSPSELQLCLHPCDLEQLHQRALTNALEMFDATRSLAEDEEDEERKGLLKELTQQYGHLLVVNEQNNSVGVVEAREKYVSQMKSQLPYQTGTSTEVLHQLHERAVATAKQKFLAKRNQHTDQEEDEYMNKLMEEINEQFEEFERLNLNSNKMAMQAAEYEYNNHVMSAWGPQGCCFHPRALEELHRVALDKALQNFQTNRSESHADDFKEKLVQRLENRLTELQRINEYNNVQAVTAGFAEYTRRMDKHSSPSLASLLIGPFIVKLLLALPHHHQRGRNDAIAEFRRRRRGATYDDDEHLDTLKRKIDDAYENYKNPIQAIIRELGLPMPN